MVLSDSIDTLEFDYEFSEKINDEKHELIKNVKEIYFPSNSKFDQHITTGLFPKLKKITFGVNFKGPIDLGAMSNIEEIYFPKNPKFKQKIIPGLFHKLKKVSSSISSLIDPSITNIEIIKDESNNNYSVHDLPYPNSDDSSSSGMREPDDDEYERW